jgi:hypothetical protein
LLPVIDPADPALTVAGDWADPAMYGVTVQDVTGPDPELAGARNDTVAPASLVTDVTEDGAEGGFPSGPLPATTRDDP